MTVRPVTPQTGVMQPGDAAPVEPVEPAGATGEQPSHHEGRLEHTVEALKPKLRGWLHFSAAPLALILGLGLMVYTPTEGLRAAVAVYVLTTVLLFGVSAAYHLGAGSTRVNAFLRKLDHANIYLFIAGSYTPFAAALDDSRLTWTILILVWGIALLLGLGGLLYTAGGVIYARKSPNPHPEWFGFHELFHAFTIGAYLVQYVAVAMVVLG